MKVIIAEKPSLARTIASALGNPTKKTGYFQVDDVIITYAYGHLLELKDMNEYFGEKIKWGDKLPFYPTTFKYHLKKQKGVKEQFNIIQSLINDENTTEIICAGDADREGEVIVRLILKFALKDNTKKITRLWLPDQTPDTIRKEMNNRKLDSEYDNLYDEGLTRMYIDWLLGINLTRSISSKANTLLNVGRVICPIVMEIYNRDMQIKNFVPEKYFGIESKVNGINLASKQKCKKDELEKCKMICQDFNSNQAYVKDIEKKEVIKKSPKLFSLSKLQGYCGKKFKLKPKETLEIVQALYEAGYVTYPRTNTEYLSENEKDKVKELISTYTTNKLPLAFKDTKRIFDDSKIESHSALMPTNKQVGEGLSKKELDVYNAIFNRFKSNFCAEDCVIEETKAIISVGNKYQEDITIKGVQLQKSGWTMVENDVSLTKLLLPLEKGQQLKVDFKPIEKATNPPKKYTVETLGNWMTNPFRKETDTEDEEYKALLSGCEIGTEATRAGIIDKAINVEYISLKNNVYSIEKKGEFMVNVLNQLKCDMSPTRTVELQKELKKVYKGELSTKEAIETTIKFLDNYFKSANEVDEKAIQFNSKSTVEMTGKCPWCSKPIYKYKSKYGTYYSHDKEEKANCTFSLDEKQKVYGNELSFTDVKVKKLLDHKLPEFEFVSKKTGKPYKAGLDVTNTPNQFNGKNYPDFKIVFKK